MIADYVGRHSTPDQRIAVLGSEPELYFYAQRRPASRHIFVYHLTEKNAYALAMQKEVARDIEAAKPEFIVSFDIPNSWWMVVPDPHRYILDWSTAYLNRYYRRVGLADIRSLWRTDYFWDEDAARAKPRGTLPIWVFKRKHDGEAGQ